MIKVDDIHKSRIHQGDIFKDIEFIEKAVEIKGKYEISKIIFPLIIILTQECDLEQDHSLRSSDVSNHDKYLLSVLVAPMYNIEHLCEGSHLSELDLKMQSINKYKSHKKITTQYNNLVNNQNPRYHYLDFPEDIPIVNSVIDFKHYFSVNIEYLNLIYKENFIGSVPILFRERISQRFANFLARIGLPNN